MHILRPQLTKAQLHQHLSAEHKLSPLSEYLKEIVYGGVDGIVTTFAVVAGFAGANIGNVSTYSIITVLLFGFANLFADAASMALGNVLSVRAQQDVYKGEKNKELHEIRHSAAFEKAETIAILMQKGFSRQHAQTLTDIYAHNEHYWADFMMNHELEMPNPEKTNPLLTGLSTFSAFIAFGFIPLIPYLLIHTSTDAFITSIGFTVLALLILGTLRWKVSKENVVRSIGEIVLLGSVSATIAFIVGTFFS